MIIISMGNIENYIEMIKKKDKKNEYIDYYDIM